MRVPTALITRALLTAVVAVVAAAPALADLELPRLSPNATVSQVVGVTNVTITYSRPGVKGRVIWGGLVPYGEVWRTGANEATTITFGNDVTIDGHALPAGTYALMTIPGPDQWTVVFNKDAKQWGAYQYKAEQDALRITVKPEPAPFAERMTFSFPDTTSDATGVALTWDKLRVGFTVKVDTVGLVTAQARTAVAAAKPDDWRTPLRAATFCLDNNVDLAEARSWLDRSLTVKETMPGLAAKARFLALDGKKAEAIATAKKAIAVGKAADPKAETGAVEKLIAEWEKP
ncbi:MAG: DUF2911 domain-containing protein [Acidobacteriota bacterium]